MTEPNPYASQPNPPQPPYNGQNHQNQQPSPYTTQYSGEPKTNVLAIIALITGFLFPLAGIITGHIALGQIKRTGENGRGLALAGTVIGYVLTALAIIVTIIYVVFIVAIVNSGSSGYTGY